MFTTPHALMEQESLEGDALDDLLLNIQGPSGPLSGDKGPAETTATAGTGTPGR